MKKIVLIIGAFIFFIFGIIFLLHRQAKPTAIVSFVIDDWGYNKANLDLLLEIQRPLTISVLPNLRYSNEIIEEVREKNKLHDIILHLPLESKSNVAAEINTIRCDMDDDLITSILETNLKSMPDIIGVSTHQGSKATKNKRVMKIVLNELKKRKLFFLDSLTTPDSVCQNISRDINLRFAKRDVFLDLTDERNSKQFETYIKRQIQKLVNVAKKKGKAVGIGHNKRITLKVIRDSIPRLEKEGIRIVPLKELVR